MACLRLVTFLPLRPLFNFPSFIACISVSTYSPAEGPYLRVDFLADFFAAVFLAGVELFFVAMTQLLSGIAKCGKLMHVAS
jgi:hypothetical protein